MFIPTWLNCAIVFAIFGGVTAPQPSPKNTKIESLIAAGRRLRVSGDCATAVPLLVQARTLAVQTKQPHAEARAGLAQGACEIRLFRYRSAIATLLDAERAAQKAGDRDLLGATAGNMSVIYSQLGDYVAAEAADLRAVEYLRTSQRHDYLVSALINLGETEFGLNRVARAKQSFYEAIEIAKKFELRLQEASAKDHLGIWLVLKNELSEARPLLQSAYDLRNESKDAEGISVSLEHLAELYEHIGGTALTDALSNINQVLRSRATSKTFNPTFYPFHLRGRIYQKLHRNREALQDFRQAVLEAESWRQGALPGDTIRTRTSAQLADVYQDCIQLLAELSIRTHDSSLAQEGYQLLLRQQNNSLEDKRSDAVQTTLLDNEEYRSLLQQLQAAQAVVTLAGKDAQDNARQSLTLIKGRVRDFEHRFSAGADPQPPSLRNFYTLSKLQATITSDTALLSLFLGDPRSYLWTVTRSQLNLYELPAGDLLSQQAIAFRSAVSQGALGNSPAGKLLAQSLFSQLSGAVLTKKEWLISAGGELDLIPFAALPVPNHAEQYLVHQHAMRMVTGFRSTSASARTGSPRRFLGIGDPIYNRADPRLDRRRASRGSVLVNRESVLARLVGSQKEIEISSKQLSIPDINLLSGSRASISNFVEYTKSEESSIIHFAVHVVSPKGHPGEAALALSLGADLLPELLTPETISTLQVPKSLVVLSGCASQQGDVIPGAGVVGLSRSWLYAGAEAVVVSAWPTPDNSGEFFKTFYENFQSREGTLAQRAAAALRSTQLAAIARGHYKENVSFWAAYSVIARN